MKNIMWKVLAIAGASAAAAVATRLSTTTWKIVRGDEPPSDVEDPDIDVKEAVAFALLSGALMGAAKLLVNRGVAKARFSGAEGQVEAAKAKSKGK